MVGIAHKRIDGCDAHLAPVTHRADDDFLRTALQDVDVLVGVGPA